MNDEGFELTTRPDVRNCILCNAPFVMLMKTHKICSQECLAKNRSKYIKTLPNHKATQIRYRTSQKGRDNLKKYQQTAKYQEYLKKYHQSERYKELQRGYKKTEKYKQWRREYHKKYRKTEAYQTYYKAYQRTPKHKAYKRNYYLTHKEAYRRNYEKRKNAKQ